MLGGFTWEYESQVTWVPSGMRSEPIPFTSPRICSTPVGFNVSVCVAVLNRSLIVTGERESKSVKDVIDVRAAPEKSNIATCSHADPTPGTEM